MNVKDLGHWTDKRKEDENLDAPIPGRKNASNFGLEIMPAISGRKICLQFLVEKYASNFGSENMPAILGRKINAGNVGKFGPEKNSGKFGPEKKCLCFREGIKLPENQQLPENSQVCLIDWKNRRLPIQEMGKHIESMRSSRGTLCT